MGGDVFVMLRTLSTGLGLALAAVVMTLLGATLDLGLESVTLLGLALGATVALVPDATTGRRLAGFLAGFVIALLGYFVRAGLLPDTTSGRAVAVGVVVLLCAVAVAATAGRLPLWAVLLGTAGLSGAYELTYAGAPTEIFDTSLSTGTSLLLSVAVGFVVGGLVSQDRAEHGHRATPGAPSTRDDDTDLNQMMEPIQ